MAKPRVFISSTFYDLKHVREDIAHFIKEKGFDTILFERGEIPYGKDSKPEEYCYQEIELSDILVCMIGGRYGAQSTDGEYSITQKELKHALESGKHVYIFVDKNVLAEYETYKVNKDNKNINFKHADDKKVYEFLDEIYRLPRNNSAFPFESSQDIIKILKEQWAGLFQRLLRKEEERSQFEVVQSLKSAVSTLDGMVNLVMEKNENQQSKFEDIILFNHPAFSMLKEKLNIRYRVTFINYKELNDLLVSKGFVESKEHNEAIKSDSPFFDDVYFQWAYTDRYDTKILIRVHKDIFDEEGNLIPMQTLDKSMIIKEETPAVLVDLDDDDLPF